MLPDPPLIHRRRLRNRWVPALSVALPKNLRQAWTQRKNHSLALAKPVRRVDSEALAFLTQPPLNRMQTNQAGENAYGPLTS